MEIWTLYFLIQKKKPFKRKIDKKKLLEISCWNDEDIKAIEDAGKAINKWKETGKRLCFRGPGDRLQTLYKRQ